MSVDLNELLRFYRVMLSSNAGDHFLTLGIEVDEVADAYTKASMGYSNAIIGDPDTRVIHGGPVTSLLDTACGFAAGTHLSELGFTPTIDLRIDYMRPAVPGERVIAEAELYRATEYVFFARAVAHHGDKDRPIARAVGNFFRLNPEVFAGVRENFRKAEAGMLGSPDYLTSVAPFDPTAFDLSQEKELLAFFDRVPYAKTLGVEVMAEAGCCLLPPRQCNIGNPSLPALHGGAIAGFMEMSAVVAAVQKTGIARIPRIIDISVDYLRAGGFKNTYSRCKLNYLGQRMVNVSIIAWQDDENKPIATARAQFLLKD